MIYVNKHYTSELLSLCIEHTSLDMDRTFYIFIAY